MTLDFQCEANCLFVSCTSTSEGCSCQCRGLFKCSCSVGSGDNQASVDKISINPEQYLRLKKFSETLLSLNDENANLANEALIGVVESVKTRDDNKFKFNLSALKSLLKQLSFDSKSEVNTFLKSLNSKFSLI